MQSIGEFWAHVTEFIAIWALFHRFGSIGGWSLPEVALLYGLVNTQWAITDMIGRGFDAFDTMVKSGDFDRVLLRPRATTLQLAGLEFTLRRLGRLAQGLAILVWALVALNILWTPGKVALFVLAVAGGVCLFYGLLVVQATLCFWTVESLEIMNVFTYGGLETARYPVSIYRPNFRRFFTAVVPLACVTYFPALALLGRADPLGSTLVFQYAAPLAGLIFLLVSLQVWKFGVRHYQSTGS
ncbi:MAG: ABC-2 family transporter protein [Candidatus Hydrogenedentes bacterium]|nr:ABC-2 family transporter protein [Candidatus Hydrogenedentota bacterium]